MQLNDLKNELTILNAGSSPGSKTSTITGTALNLQGYQGTVAIVQDVGTVSGTTPTLDGKIQDSADGSTGWGDVTGYTFTQVTTSTNIQVLNVDPRFTKQYIRYIGTIAGTTPNFSMDVVLIAMKQYK